MSYCRWSDNDFQCDVYVYEDVSGGWTTHVAGSRYVFNEPLPDPVAWSAENMKAWWKRYDHIRKLLESSNMEKIGLPYDGETFNHGSPSDCATFLCSLRDMGYNVPQYAIDALNAENESEPPHAD